MDIISPAFIPSDQASLHVPEVGTIDGLVDLLSTCTLGILLGVLDFRTYGTENMPPHDQKMWTLHDDIPLPLTERLENQYARGQCSELLDWVDEHFSLMISSDGITADISIKDVQATLFKRHVDLLEKYKRNADAAKFMKTANFTLTNVKTQLDAIRKKYSSSTVRSLEFSGCSKLFDLLGVVGVKAKKQLMFSSATPRREEIKFKQLMKLGESTCDMLNQAATSMPVAFGAAKWIFKPSIDD